MVKISKEDLAKLAIGWGVANFLTKGALERPIQSATIRAITKAAPAIGRAVVRYGPAAVGTAARVTPAGVVASTAGVIAIQNREKIADLASQGYEIVAPRAQGIAERSMEFARDPIGYSESVGAEFDPFRPIGGVSFPVPKKKKPTKFNRAVKKGMSVIKASTSYGKKGTINNAKRAFTAVTKTASTLNRGGKVAKSGIKRKIGLAIRSIL